MRIVLLILLFLGPATASGEPLTIVTWNVESGGSDPSVIATQLAELPVANAYLLQEVNPRDIGRYAAAIRKAHGGRFKHYLGSLGGSDRLAMFVNEEEYAIEAFSELISFDGHQLNDWRHRSPLVARLRRRSDGVSLLLVTVHLARGNDRLREEQANGLREWARAQQCPVILAGDCNFDYDFQTKQGNAAYDAFFRGGVWIEAKPEELVDTNWSDSDGDGQDNYPDSSLDFVAFCPHAATLAGSSRVLVRPGDFPDTKATSDHRPVLGVLRLDGSAGGSSIQNTELKPAE